MLLLAPRCAITELRTHIPRLARQLPQQHPETAIAESVSSKVSLQVEVEPAEQVGLNGLPELVEDLEEACYSPDVIPWACSYIALSMW